MQFKIAQGIKFKFVLIFSIILAGFSIIAYTYNSVLEINAEAGEKTALLFTSFGLINQIELNVRRAREAEKNYLLEENKKYAAEHAAIASETRTLIAELQKTSLRNAEMINMTSSGGRILYLLNVYEANFKAVIAARESRLSSIASLQELVMTLEKAVLSAGDLKLSNAFLKIRGLEKDFIATEDSRFVTQLNNDMKDFALLLFDAQIAENRRTEISAMMNKYNLAMLALTNGTKTVADRVSRFNEIVIGLNPLMAKLKEMEKSSIASSHQEMQTRISERNRIFIMTAVLVGMVSLVFLFNAAMYITRNINEIISAIKHLSRGNLAIALFQNNDSDEISRLYNSLYHMRLKLTEVIRGIRAGAGNVGEGAKLVAQGNANLSQRTQEQASSLEEVASSMEEMTSTVSQNADNAQQASELANGARMQAEQGGEAVSKVIAAMAGINTASQKIADIIGVIDEIAFQTNLLALNAAVEAAHAGAQGRGFAVVANEVRILAGRSKEAAQEIKTLVEDNVVRVETGARLVDESGRALEGIVLSVQKVNDIVAEIAAASQEQSCGIQQVNKALLQLDEMTQQNASLVEEEATVSENLKVRAEGLRQLVEFFSLETEAAAPGETKTAVNAVRATHSPKADEKFYSYGQAVAIR